MWHANPVGFLNRSSLTTIESIVHRMMNEEASRVGQYRKTKQLVQAS